MPGLEEELAALGLSADGDEAPAAAPTPQPVPVAEPAVPAPSALDQELAAQGLTPDGGSITGAEQGQPAPEQPAPVEPAPLSARVNLRDAQGNVVNVGRQHVKTALDSGTYRLDASEAPQTGMVPVLEQGRVSLYPAAEAQQKLAQGGLIATPQEVEQEFGDVGSQVAAGLEGAAQGASFGAYGYLADKAGGPGYTAERQMREEQNPITAGVGQVVGAVAPALLSGGVGAAGAAARLTGAGRLASLSARVGEALMPTLGKTAAGRVALSTGLAAAEGAIDNTARQVFDDLTNNVPLSAERMADAAWDGAKFGGAAGVIFGAGVEGVTAAARRFGKAAQHSDELARVVSEADERLAAAQSMDARPAQQVDADIATMRQNVDSATAAGDHGAADDAAAQLGRLMDEREALAARDLGFQTQADITAQLQLPPQDQGMLAKLEARLNKAKNAQDARNALDDEVGAGIRGFTEDMDAIQRFRQNEGDTYLNRGKKLEAVRREMAADGHTWTEDQAASFMQQIDDQIEELRSAIDGKDAKLYSEQEKRMFNGALKKAEEAREIVDGFRKPPIADTLLDGAGRSYPIDAVAAAADLAKRNNPAGWADEFAEHGGYTKYSIEEIPLSQIDVQKTWAPEKLVNIEQAFAAGTPLPPVAGSRLANGRVDIKDGIHRVQASIANGKKTVPVLVGKFVKAKPPSATMGNDADSLARLFMVGDDYKREIGRLAVRNLGSKKLQRQYMEIRAMNQDAGLWGARTAEMQTNLNAAITREIRSAEAMRNSLGRSKGELTERAGEFGFDVVRDFDPKKIDSMLKDAAGSTSFKEEATLIGGIDDMVKRMEVEAQYYPLPPKAQAQLEQLKLARDRVIDRFKNIKALSQKKLDAERILKETSSYDDFVNALRANPWTAPIGVTAQIAVKGVAAPVLAMAKGAVKTERALENAAKRTAKNFFSGEPAKPVAGLGMTANQIRKVVSDAQALQDPSSDASRNLAVHMRELSAESPQLAQQVEAGVRARAGYIMSKIGPQVDDSDPFGARPAAMDPITRLRVQRYVQAAQHIDAVADRLANGTATAEDVDAMRQLRPALFSRYVDMIRQKMGEAKKPPTLKQRNRLNFMLGIPMTREQDPAYVAFLQSVTSMQTPTLQAASDAAQENDMATMNGDNLKPVVTPGKANLEFKADQRYASRTDAIRSAGADDL